MASEADTKTPRGPRKSVEVSDTAESLTPAELLDRLCLNSPELVDELHEWALRKLAEEEARGGRLESKASSLFSATGISITVATSFGAAVLLQHPEAFRAVGAVGFWVVVIAFFLALWFGLRASHWALKALKVRGDFRSLDEHTIFRKDVLRRADTEEDGKVFYRRYMIAHVWQIAQSDGNIHEEKATFIREGQSSFQRFLVTLFILGCLIGAGALFAASGENQCPPSPPSDTLGSKAQPQTETHGQEGRTAFGRIDAGADGDASSNDQ